MSDQPRTPTVPTIDLAELRRLEAEATPGPWMDFGNLEPYEGHVVAVGGDSLSPICQDPDGDDRPHDRALIAALRNAAPNLLARAELAARMAARLKADKERLAWSYGDGSDWDLDRMLNEAHALGLLEVDDG